MRTRSEADIELFAVMSGDLNPAHVDEQYAATALFERRCAGCLHQCIPRPAEWRRLHAWA
jgi:acyl dehydratase